MSEILTLATDFNFLGTPEGVGKPAQPLKPQKPCTPQEIEYITELIRNGGHALRAARTVGYSDSQARGAHGWIKALEGDSTKPHLWETYQREMLISRAKLNVTIEQIMDEYSCVAFTDPINMLDDKGDPLPVSHMDHRTRRAISKIKYIRDSEGNLLCTDITMIDKKGALDSLAKIMGMLKDKIEHTHTFTGLLDDLSAGDEPLVLTQDKYKEVYEALDG